MLDPNSMWWKYIKLTKMKELLNQLPPEVEYVTNSMVGEIVLLNGEKEMIGIISVSNEKLDIFKDMDKKSY